MIPSIEIRPDFVLLSRHTGDTKFLLYLPEGDSFYLKPDEVLLWFERIGVQEPQSIIDYAWNFNTVYVDCVLQRYWWINREDLKQLVSKSEENADVLRSLASE